MANECVGVHFCDADSESHKWIQKDHNTKKVQH